MPTKIITKRIQKFTLLIAVILLIITGSKVQELMGYPPRDHTTWCYWCGGDGWIDYGDPPTVYKSRAYRAYKQRYYMPQGLPSDFPLTNNQYTAKRYRCQFELCASNSGDQLKGDAKKKKVLSYYKYASTAIVDMVNCYECHNLSRTKTARGSKAIDKKFTPKNGDINSVKCDICHNYKRYEGSAKSYESMIYWDRLPDKESSEENLHDILHPYAVSLHPFRVIDDKSKKIQFNGNPDPSQIDRDATMQCSFCHDPELASLPYHKDYKTRFRLRAGSAGPDVGSDSSVYVEKKSLSSWLDTTGRNVNVPAPIGTVEDDTSSVVPPVFKRANSRTKMFYSNNFCLQCHDYSGHISNRYKATTDSTRFAPDIAGTWNDEDSGGHVIRQKGKYLKPDDRLPCTVCHDPHSSGNNPFLLKDSLYENTEVGSGQAPLVPRLFCQKCHYPPDIYQASFFDTGIIYKYNTITKKYDTFDTIWGKDGAKMGVDPILEGIILPIAPGVVDRAAKRRALRPLYTRREVNEHYNSSTVTCIGAYDFNRKYYYLPEKYEIQEIPLEKVQAVQNGCHSTAHNPKRLTCEGCHKEEFDWSFYNQAGRPKYRRKELMKAGLWKNFIRHPVYVSINDKEVNHIDIDDEVKNWFFDPSGLGLQQKLKEFLAGIKDPAHGDSSIIDTTLPWKNVMLGKSWNPPVMEGTSKDIITCLSCHNDHFVSNKDKDGVTLVYPDSTQAYLRMDMPYLCMTCHPKGIRYDSGTNKIVAVENRHGGFLAKDANETGKCNTCHSMHGRHPLDSSRSYDLTFGAYSKEMDPKLKEIPTGDTTFDGQKIYRDVRGRTYSKHLRDTTTLENQPYAHLIHNRNQIITCGRCHGMKEGVDALKMLGRQAGDTTKSDFRWPGNVLYPATGNPTSKHSGNYVREDTYFTTAVWRNYAATNFMPVRRKSEHDIDKTDDQDKGYNIIPGGSGYSLHLRCGYCHDPHGSDNYVQLRERVPISFSSQETGNTTWIYNGNVGSGGDNYTPTRMRIVGDNKVAVPPGDYRKFKYDSGIVDFCTACHLTLDDKCIEYPGDIRYMEPKSREGINFGYVGKNFARHPNNISMRTLLNNIAYRRGDTTGIMIAMYKHWDTLVLQGKYGTGKTDTWVDSTVLTPGSKQRIGDIICLTCHNAHASNNKILRKGYDYGINSCINICHPYVKIRNAGVY